MQEKKEVNQNEYIKEYNKKHYSYLKVQLKKEEKEELDQLLKKLNISKPEFIRQCINLFKQGKNKN